MRATSPAHPIPPRRPSRRQEALAHRLFLALAPRLRSDGVIAPPGRFAPFELLSIPCRDGRGHLAGTWFPAPGRDRGTVLLLPPWTDAGRSYLHHRGRIQALRGAGYDVLTIELPSASRAGGFFDRDVEDALDYLARRKRRPIHLWGVSSGGYWAHPVLSRSEIPSGAFFEDVSPHLLEWSRRMIPWGRPCYAFFRHALPAAYRFLDMRFHAAAFRLGAVAYLSGGDDRGVPPPDTRALATAAGAVWRIVPGARHLGAIQSARRTVVDLALATFERATANLGAPPRRLALYPSAVPLSAPSSRSMSSSPL